MFLPARDTPVVLENLWRQTVTAYLENPLPALFKEKLFTHLSRFSSSPYSTVKHAAELWRQGVSPAAILEFLDGMSPFSIDIEQLLVFAAKGTGPSHAWSP